MQSILYTIYQFTEKRLAQVEVERHNQTVAMRDLESTIIKYKNENSELIAVNKSLLAANNDLVAKNKMPTTENLQLQTKLQALENDFQNLHLTNQQLQKQINKLQHENYLLQGHDTSMTSNFPTVEKTLTDYSHFGSQKLVHFISTFEKLYPTYREFVEGTRKLVEQVRAIILQQRVKINSLLFPGSLASLADTNATFPREFSTYLQQNYKQVMSLNGWLSQNETSIEQLFLAAESPLQSNPKFVQGLSKIVFEMHELLWQVTLTRGLMFGVHDTYNETLHNNPFNERSPIIVLPHLIDDASVVVAKGFVY